MLCLHGERLEITRDSVLKYIEALYVKTEKENQLDALSQPNFIER